MNFEELGLDAQLLRAIEAMEYTTPTAIQEAAIPAAMAGRDVLGCAQTGTGKTASFALPMLHRLKGRPAGRHVGALILAPTRELVAQIYDNFVSYGRHLSLTCGMVIGGVNIRPQTDMLRRKPDILVATPGRLLDHLQRNNVQLQQVEMVVLDEADRMFDMGFIRDIRSIFRHLPARRQTLLFSATLPDEIKGLAREVLHDPVRIDVAKRSSTPRSVRQVIVSVPADGKKTMLLRLLASQQILQAIVFTRTKWGANKLTGHLEKHGHHVAVIHGNKSQAQRQSALQGFRDGRVRVLVATDIASRGLDIEGVSHVINYELPNAPEDYVHRIGRTGRATATGVAISLVSDTERSLVRSIERLTGTIIPRQIVDGANADPLHA